jgi:hypothetical protein
MLDHMERARLGYESCVKGWILAGEINFVDEGGGGDGLLIGGSGIVFGWGDGEREN